MIQAIIARIKFNKLLKQCLTTSQSGVECFEYNGNLYDKEKFIQLKSKALIEAYKKAIG